MPRAFPALDYPPNIVGVRTHHNIGVVCLHQ